MFELVVGAEDDWIYCSGRKMVEIYGNPAALDGVHFLPADYAVKADFSEYKEIIQD